ncbi:MAG: hypothetical protein AB8B63_00640 [Granulosicoccus sp.]
MVDDTLTKAELVHVLHDLNGPIVTAIGFQNEVEQTLREFRKLIKQFEPDNDAGAAALHSVVEEDLAPCLEHLGAALAMLKSRVNQLADIRPGESGESGAQ